MKQPQKAVSILHRRDKQASIGQGKETNHLENPSANLAL